MSINLKKAKQGKRYKVNEINGNPETKQFLSNIGLEIGDSITVISRLGGNMIINIKDGRFGIDLKVAKLIEVIEWNM